MLARSGLDERGNASADHETPFLASPGDRDTIADSGRRTASRSSPASDLMDPRTQKSQKGCQPLHLFSIQATSNKHTATGWFVSMLHDTAAEVLFVRYHYIYSSVRSIPYSKYLFPPHPHRPVCILQAVSLNNHTSNISG